MTLLTIDFETYYDKEYSLSKTTTEEYLRSPLFECIGVSVKVDTQPAQWFSGSFQETHLWLSQFDWAGSSVCSHNAMFDMGILQWRFGLRPGFILDTMSMGKGLFGLATSCSLLKLGEYLKCTIKKGNEVVNALGLHREEFDPAHLKRYGEYCIDDTELCFELLQKMHPWTQPKELQLIDWTIRAFTEPKLILNEGILMTELLRFRANRANLLTSCGVTDIAQLRSDAYFEGMLAKLGVEVPKKISPKTGNLTYAFSRTDHAFMDLLEDEDEQVVALVEARLGSKTSITETRLERLLGISRRGPMPVPLGYAGAGPKRWVGMDKINLQNLPRNKKEAPSPLRQAIEAPPGFLLAAPDLSQIELRVNCWQSGQQDVLDLLAAGGDAYSDMGGAIHGITITREMGATTHKVERFGGKTAVLGCGYGCGPDKFRHMLKTAARQSRVKIDESPQFSDNVVRTYREKNSHVAAFWKVAANALPIIASGGTTAIGPYAIKDGRVWLPNGTYLYYPNLRQEMGEKGMEWVYDRVRRGRPERCRIYGAKLVENITQAVARVVMSDAMIRIKDRYRIVGTVHDELLVLVPEHEDLYAFNQFITQAMTVSPDWAPSIPLACEITVGANYAACK